jgi:hypothetical protein
MSNRQTVTFDAIRTLAQASISSSYAAVGGPFVNPVRLICITNNTDGDMFFSVDGTTNHLFIPKGAFKLFDLNTNRTHVDQYWVLPANTQFYVKYSTAPMSGAVYIECLWGQ